MTQAVKDDAGKLRYDLIPPFALKELARVFSYGAEKYGERNWEAGLDWEAFAPLKGTSGAGGQEDADEETGISHLAHAAWNCLALLEFARTHPEETTDRFSCFKGKFDGLDASPGPFILAGFRPPRPLPARTLFAHALRACAASAVLAG